MEDLCLSDLIITDVYSVSHLYSPAQKSAKRRTRSHWALIFKYEGATVYTYDGGRLISDADRAVLLPKGCSYDWLCTKAGHVYSVEFECALSHPRPIGLSVKSGEKLLKLYREAERKSALNTPFARQELIRDTYTLLLSVLQTEQEAYLPGNKQAKIAPAVDYIAQNYHSSLSNDALAALTGLSTVYFRKLFTEIMGVSPISYVHRLRIAKAKEMLKSDYGTLGDVAVALGYANLYDFSRDFKKHTGLSPSRYAKS